MDPKLHGAVEWMRRYGHWQASGADALGGEGVELALQETQRFLGLSPTGRLDAATLEAMSAPRCAHPDFPRGDQADKGWPWREVQYAFGRDTRQAIGAAAARDAVRRALATWAGAGVGLRFDEYDSTEYPPMIRFEWVELPDADYDLSGNALAHAGFPVEGWQPPSSPPVAVHFDDTEPTWRIGSAPDVESAALHEIGHALGLTHSSFSQAVMYPYLALRQRLQAEDIQRLRRLYPTLQVGQVVRLVCQGSLAGPRYLDGRTLEGRVMLAPHANPPFTGTSWAVLHAGEAGVFALAAQGDKPGPRVLDGWTETGEARLAPEVGGRYTGTRWKLHHERNERVALECLGDRPGPRFLDGHTQTGVVRLAPAKGGAYSGTLWSLELT